MSDFELWLAQNRLALYEMLAVTALFAAMALFVKTLELVQRWRKR